MEAQLSAAHLEFGMGKPAKAPIYSRWEHNRSKKIWVVVDRRPGGHTDMQQEGKACFMTVYLQHLLADSTRLPDAPYRGATP